jgi:hypothetical protein
MARMVEKPQNALATVYKLLRWVVLGGLILFIFVALRRPEPPSSPVAPETAKQDLQSFNDKMEKLASAHGAGEPAEARFDSDEVNSAIQNSMAGPEGPLASATASTAPVDAQTAAKSSGGALTPESDVGGALPVQTVQVGFLADQVIGQFATKIYDKDVYITIAGRLGSKDGYVTFDPTVFKVGDLSVPVSLVNNALQKKLAEPENRDKLKLPEYVSSLRIEDGQLVIAEK